AGNSQDGDGKDDDGGGKKDNGDAEGKDNWEKERKKVTMYDIEKMMKIASLIAMFRTPCCGCPSCCCSSNGRNGNQLLLGQIKEKEEEEKREEAEAEAEVGAEVEVEEEEDEDEEGGVESQGNKAKAA
ncbi:unnamed protein product, partial [Protopolystoma xenopodis]